ncbi:hypothetical protein SNE40_020664 [Patella caerulea]|uniref:Uncharacterized protein n=1 Tax=Patella caerulea TaxID=87958 RepID=A0AAN8P3I2_PATCE
MSSGTRRAFKKVDTDQRRQSLNAAEMTDMNNKLTIMKNNMLTKDDIKTIVSDITSSILLSFKEELNAIHEKLDTTLKENGLLRKDNDKLRVDFNELKETSETERQRINEAISMANYNEQYSRKNNIRVSGIHFPDSDEPMKETFMKVVHKHIGVSISPTEITAIHPLPSTSFDKPSLILVKMSNSEAKRNLMMHKKIVAEKNVKFTNDITKSNLSLMNRANNMDCVEKSWYYNGQVYAKSKGRVKIKINLFENFRDKLMSAPFNQRRQSTDL